MHLEDRLRDAQLVLARLQLVVHEGARQLVLAVVAGRHGDLGLAALVLALERQGQEGGEVLLERRGVVPDLLEVAARKRQHGARGDRLGGELPDGVLVEHGLLAEPVAVTEHTDHRLVTVLAGADLVDLAVRDQVDPVRGLAALGQHLARAEVALLAAVGQRGQHLVVLEPAQQCQLTQLLRDDPDLGTGLDELDPAVTDGVGQSAVDPVGATGGLHPGQHLEQPAGGDLLHLRRGLGGGGEIAGSGRRQARLRHLRCLRGRLHGHRQGSPFRVISHADPSRDRRQPGARYRRFIRYAYRCGC